MIALVSSPGDHGTAGHRPAGHGVAAQGVAAHGVAAHGVANHGAVGHGLPDAPAAPHRPARDAASDPARVALDVSRLTVTRMAEELGIPRATLEAYRLGTRRMPAASRARLAAYLTAHAELLRRMARRLRGEED